MGPGWTCDGENYSETYFLLQTYHINELREFELDPDCEWIRGVLHRSHQLVVVRQQVVVQPLRVRIAGVDDGRRRRQQHRGGGHNHKAKGEERRQVVMAGGLAGGLTPPPPLFYHGERPPRPGTVGGGEGGGGNGFNNLAQVKEYNRQENSVAGQGWRRGGVGRHG
jgi:hypothetical protein